MKEICPICRGRAVSNGQRLGTYKIVTCGGCTLRFAPEAFSVAVDYEQIYESPEYIESQVKYLTDKTDFRRFAEHPTYKPFFNEVPRTGAARLLDVGCGVGRFAQAAERFGWTVCGADISEQAIQMGRQYASFPLLTASVDELLSKPERYDVVTAFEVLEHQPDPLAYLRKMKDLAAENGVVFCTVPNWECNSVQSAVRPDWIPPVHLCFFTPRALQRAGELAGFAVVKTGIIWTQGRTKQPSGVTRWFRRRDERATHEALGLWVMGRKSADNC